MIGLQNKRKGKDVVRGGRESTKPLTTTSSNIVINKPQPTPL